MPFSVFFLRVETCLYRWQPPIPIAKWAPRVINGTQVHPACAQTTSTINSVVTPFTVSL